MWGERMTNREAVARIKDHIEVHHIKEDRAIKIVQALNMAIKALERTEWHYPSKGELPTNDEEILCKLPYKGYAVGKYNATFNYFGFEDFNTTPINIECWRYIIPPKEER